MRRPAVHKCLVIVSVMVLALPLINAVVKIARDPAVPFLMPEEGAEWVRIERPFNLATWRGDQWVAYRRSFTLEREIPDALLTVRAMRRAVVQIDGLSVLQFNNIDDWKIPRTVSLKGHLTPGVHELRVIVMNRNGPAILLAYSKALHLFTGKKWEASVDGSTWRPVITAAEKGPVNLDGEFPGTSKALASLSGVYLPFFLICLALILFVRPALQRHYTFRKLLADPSIVRWLLIGAWAVLAVNDITKVPLYVGFDSRAHYQYISYLAEKGALPLANEGWQMFQPPLFYLIAVFFRMILSLFSSPQTTDVLLRIIPLLCGAAQVELSYRATRLVFPERNDLQIIGMMIGGFMPMNLYISQVVGNEPLAGALTGTAIVMTLRILHSGNNFPSMNRLMVLGGVISLALLTKFTAVLIIPSILLALIYSMISEDGQASHIAKSVSVFLGTIVVVSGWYYLRNWIELGKPFIGGWDSLRGIVWWQDPGFRTIHDFISFGSALTHPIYAALNGFWDSIYSTTWLDGCLSSSIAYPDRPPWNYDFMISSAFFSLVPAAGLLTGFIAAVGKPKSARPGEVFSAYSVALYFAALLYLYVTLPIYSTAKATYTIGLLPCYAILCVKGIDIISRNRYMEAIVYAFIICWAVNAYASFFVL